jgi:CheY-like chemotaxis protein
MSTAESPFLLVEDDANDVLLMRAAFDSLGVAAPMEVTDGEQAHAYLAGRDAYADRLRYPLPSVVLLDLKLPRKSGFEVLEWRQQQPALQQIPFIILTASNEVSDIRRAYALGANSYLVKPTGYGRLVDMVRSILHYWGTLNAHG